MGLKTLASNRNNRYSAGQIKLPKITRTLSKVRLTGSEDHRIGTALAGSKDKAAWNCVLD